MTDNGDSPEDRIMRVISARAPLIEPLERTNRFRWVAIISGVLAIMIAGSICFRYVMHGAEPIPDVLTYALSTIIGFYFGAGVSGAFQAPAPSN
jgi:hypothetical protein